MQQNKNCDGDIMQLVSVPNLHRREARAFQKTSQPCSKKKWKERRNERNCAGSRKRIFKDKKNLKDFQLRD